MVDPFGAELFSICGDMLSDSLHYQQPEMNWFHFEWVVMFKSLYGSTNKSILVTLCQDLSLMSFFKERRFVNQFVLFLSET